MYLKVFFPCSYISSDPGLLIGNFYLEKGCYYVLSIIPLENCNSVLNKINFGLLPNKEKYEILGLWLAQVDDAKFIIPTASIGLRKDWIVLKKCDRNINLIHISPKQEIDSMLSQSGVVFLFSDMDVLEGKNILPQFQKHLPQHTPKRTIPNTTNITSGNNGDCRNITDSKYLREVADIEMMIYLYSTVVMFHNRATKIGWRNTAFQSFFVICSLYQFFTNIFSICVFKFLKKVVIKCLIFIKSSLLDKAAHASSVVAHLSLKFKLFQSLCDPESTQEHRCNVALAILCDIFLGILFCFWLLTHSSLWFYASEILMPSVDIIAKNVEILIRWLMGIPIGLKLNSPLNQFLGKFFLHHVRLWLEYIQMVLLAFAPGIGGSVVWLFLLTCFGLSFFISILADIVSLLTFHVYCFYVYATRLYGLQIAGVMSFWRLFRGKKWNPLRHRVDTLPHSPDVANHRFFTGTLLFTILLFLLPTTALYYAIFAFLRLATLCVQKPLHWLSSCVACFPWFSLILRCVRPNAFVTHARFNRTDELQSANLENSDVLLKKISLPKNMRKLLVTDLTILTLVLDVQSYQSVICSGLKRTFGAPLFSFLNVRQFSVNLLSGKLIKWT